MWCCDAVVMDGRCAGVEKRWRRRDEFVDTPKALERRSSFALSFEGVAILEVSAKRISNRKEQRLQPLASLQCSPWNMKSGPPTANSSPQLSSKMTSQRTLKLSLYCATVCGHGRCWDICRFKSRTLSRAVASRRARRISGSILLAFMMVFALFNMDQTV